MANEISYYSPAAAGQTWYCQLVKGNQAYNTATPAWEVAQAAHFSSYAIAMTEATSSGGSGLFTAPIPAGLVGSGNAGDIQVYIFHRAGGSPATSDPMVAGEVLHWSGTADVGAGNANVATVVTGVVAADVLNATQASYVASGSIGASLNILAGTRIQKDIALPNFPFPMYLTDGVTPATGKTVTGVRSLDGASYAACANSPAEVGSGGYAINLAAGDLNGNTVSLIFTATGCAPTRIDLTTQP